MLYVKRPKHKSFDYQPRFYKPEEDEREKRKKKLKFRYVRSTSHKRKVPYFWIVLLIIVAFFYYKFGGN